MSLTMDQEDRLQGLLNDINGYRSKLSGWDLTFFDDQLKRFEEHGATISLSPKQWAQLERIHGKVTG